MADAEIVQFPSRRPRAARRRAAPVPDGLPFDDAWLAWEVALNARYRSPGTIKSYRETVQQFATWRVGQGLADDVEHVTPQDVRLFLTSERERTSPGNAAKLFRNLRAFFRWLIKEGERAEPSPVHGEDAPHVPEEERPPFTDDEVKALLATCSSRSFEDLRDRALMLVLIDAGPRSSGLVGIRYIPKRPDDNDVLLANYRVRITLKGGDIYWAPIGRKTAQALDRYIRARAKHPLATLTALFIGRKGAMSRSGVQQMLKRRGEEAGVSDVHPHRFRRTSATMFLDAGGNELEAMHVYGWKSTAMVRHYTKETARERAREAHSRFSPGDRF